MTLSNVAPSLGYTDTHSILGVRVHPLLLSLSTPTHTEHSSGRVRVRYLMLQAPRPVLACILLMRGSDLIWSAPPFL